MLENKIFEEKLQRVNYGGKIMLSYCQSDYEAILGKVSQEVFTSVKCVSQCTGCMCNCRCSCSGSIIADVEWEEL